MEPLLEVRPRLLSELSTENMESLPDLVKGTLSYDSEFLHEWRDSDDCIVEDIARFAEIVPQEFWQDRSFVLEWFGNGLPFLESFPIEWRDDKEIFLLLARYCSRLYNSFKNVSLSLCDDKNFMLKVVKHNPSLLRFAPVHLQQDFDVALAAFSGDTNRIVKYFDPFYPYEIRVKFVLNRIVEYFDPEFAYEGREKFVIRFIASIRSMASMSETFSTTVLPLIEGNKSDQKSSLSILNQGTENSKGYLDLLAKFLVPTAKQLREIHRACRILPEAMHGNLMISDVDLVDNF